MLKKYQKKKDFNYRGYAELLEAASGREFVDHAAVSFAPGDVPIAVELHRVDVAGVNVTRPS